MPAESHLVICQHLIPKGAEWALACPLWRLLQLESGFAYLLGPASRSELQPRDVLLVPPGTKDTLLASQLTDAIIEHFVVNPELIGGFLTPAEHHAFDKNRDVACHGSRHFPAASDLARQYAALRETITHSPTLAQRCQLLQLFAHALNLAPAQVRPDRLAQASEKFQALINRLSERELIQYSVGELARLCGCGPRHFNRLFHAHFGQSVRDKILSLRLQQAQELLQEGDQPIAVIAAQCGYHHLGYFSTAFKKQFGLTPTQWRAEHQQR